MKDRRKVTQKTKFIFIHHLLNFSPSSYHLLLSSDHRRPIPSTAGPPPNPLATASLLNTNPEHQNPPSPSTYHPPPINKPPDLPPLNNNQISRTHPHHQQEQQVQQPDSQNPPSPLARTATRFLDREDDTFDFFLVGSHSISLPRGFILSVDGGARCGGGKEPW